MSSKSSGLRDLRVWQEAVALAADVVRAANSNVEQVQAELRQLFTDAQLPAPTGDPARAAAVAGALPRRWHDHLRAGARAARGPYG